MKLKDFLNLQEMALPTVNSAQSAASVIRSIYNWAVVKKQPRGDFIGRLEAAVTFLKKDPAMLKYKDVLKLAVKAKKAISADRGTLSAAQAQSTTVK